MPYTFRAIKDMESDLNLVINDYLKTENLKPTDEEKLKDHRLLPIRFLRTAIALVKDAFPDQPETGPTSSSTEAAPSSLQENAELTRSMIVGGFIYVVREQILAEKYGANSDLRRLLPTVMDGKPEAAASTGAEQKISFDNMDVKSRRLMLEALEEFYTGIMFVEGKDTNPMLEQHPFTALLDREPPKGAKAPDSKAVKYGNELKRQAISQYLSGFEEQLGQGLKTVIVAGFQQGRAHTDAAIEKRRQDEIEAEKASQPRSKWGFGFMNTAPASSSEPGPSSATPR